MVEGGGEGVIEGMCIAKRTCGKGQMCAQVSFMFVPTENVD